MQKLFSCIYITIVCCMLLTPFVLWITGTEDPRPFFENRARAELPEFDVAHLDPYPAKFESHFNDYFPYRNSGIFWLNLAETKYFGRSPIEKEVTIGQEGWLYPGTRLLPFNMGQEPLTDNMLKIMMKELNDRYDFCQSIGAEYRLVIVPAKSTLYPEYLPLAYQFTVWQNPIDAFRARCSTDCKVPVLILQDSLVKHKEECELFYHTDSHWNDAGTYFGYRAIINWIYDGKVKPFDVDVHACDSTYTFTGNYSDMVGMNDYWNEERCILPGPSLDVVHPRQKENYPCDSLWFAACVWYEMAYQNADTSLPGLMVVRESYTNEYLQQLLASHFGRSTFIWDYWQHKLNKEILLNEKPEVVLCIINENFLLNLMKYRMASETGGMNRLNGLPSLMNCMWKVKAAVPST